MCINNFSEGSQHLQWLNNILQKILDRQNSSGVKQNVIIIGHLIPSTSLYIPSCLNKYMEISLKFSSIIVGHFFGHSDLDYFRTIHSRDGQPHGVFYSSGSLVASLDPTFRTFQYNENAQNTKNDPFLLDYHQYSTNLDIDNVKNLVVFKEFYSFKKSFPEYQLYHDSLFRFRQNIYSDINLWKKFLRLSFRDSPAYVDRIDSLEPPFSVQKNSKDFFALFQKLFCDGDNLKVNVKGKLYSCINLFNTRMFNYIHLQK
jgi:hypothetical protein